MQVGKRIAVVFFKLKRRVIREMLYAIVIHKREAIRPWQGSLSIEVGPVSIINHIVMNLSITVTSVHTWTLGRLELVRLRPRVIPLSAHETIGISGRL